MNRIFTSVALFFFVAFLVMSCKKDETRAILNTSGASATLTVTPSTAIVLDSTKKTSTAITFSANALNVGFKASITYTLQIDSINDNFIKPVNVVLGNSLSTSYTVADLNSLALSLGLTPTVSGKIHARIKANINQATGTATLSSIYSNVVDITITPYPTKPTPKFPVPANLYIVGDATPSGWNNPVDTPNQKFTRIDDNTFGIIVQLNGGSTHFLFLPKNGDWGHKYALGATNSTGGTFQPDAGSDIPAPSAPGLYQIIVDFVQATYTITPVSSSPNPSNLYIVGDATNGGWNNPVPVPSQQFTRISNGEFQITVPLSSGKSYLFLPLNGDWGHKYGGAGKTGGTLLADGNVPGSNTPAPDASGTYTINVNFFAKTYTVK